MLAIKSTVLIGFIWTLLTGCADKPAAEASAAFWANTRPDSVALEKGRGMVYLRVPRSYDTLFAWTRFGDCNTCDDIRYRFQPHSLPVHQEQGFYYRVPNDSVNQLTIIHSVVSRTDSPSSKPVAVTPHDSLLRQWQRAVSEEQAAKRTALRFSTFDTVEHINGQDVGIVAYSRFDTLKQVYFNSLEASVDNIRFVYELRTKQNDSTARYFRRDALRLLRTIRISPGR